MSDKKAKVLTAQRQILEAKLKRVHEFAENVRKDEIMEAVNIRLKDSREIINQIKDLDMDLLKISPEEQIDPAGIEVIYYDIETKLGSWLRTHVGCSTVNANETLNTSQVAPCHEPRLPKTVIPVFDGNYMDWPSFYDLYCSNFHDRSNLTPSQKFQYLRGYLKGEASNLIKHLPITDVNYYEAFEKLRERYSRKKQIVNSYIATFLDQRSVQAPTASALRQLLDNSDEILRGLKALGSEAESRDPWIIRLLLNKLDEYTREKWADETKGNDFPTIKKLFEFLQGRIDALEDVKTFHNFKRLSDTKSQPIRGHVSATNIMCPCCQKEEHKLYLCDQFKCKPIKERREFIQADRRCFNCLNINHSVFNCLSKKRCTKCKRKHNTLLHPEPEKASDQENQLITSIPSTQTHLSEINLKVAEISCAGQDLGSQTILPTAIARFSTANTKTIGKCRILLDSASQVSFASEAFVRRFKLPTVQRRIPVSGIGGTSAGATKGYIRLQLMNETGEKIVTVNAYVLPKVTAKLPHQECCRGNKTYFNHIQLADPEFNVPSEIDLLVGADQFFNILEDGQMKSEQHELIAQNTKFGWVIAGKPPVEVTNNSIASFHSLENIESYLRAMWEAEAVPNQIAFTSEENRCEEFYTSTTTRTEEGRYVVRLPFREEPTTLGNSIGLAIGRLRSLERRFTTDVQFAEMYRNFMNEYLTLGHMRRMNSTEIKQPGYYLPHHGILKGTGGNVKMRVVFDASAKSATGKSLNDVLMVGPTVQSSLYSILIRFRTHQFVFTADLQKMYRQIVVAPEDRKWQRILWRDSQHNQIEHFELITVTYGTGAAPLLATRTINQIAIDNRHKYPLAAREILENVYVDDIMTGASTVLELCELKKTIEQIFHHSGMTLGKWVSNCPEILEMLNPDQISNTIEIQERCDAAKVLGLCWNPIQDVLTFSAQSESDIKYTKRTLLSEASRVFDPLGLMAPCIVPIKTLFQHLWKTKLDWDDELPQNLKDQWATIRQDISDLSTINIPRWLSISSNMECEIHGFCDASEVAYGAVFYARNTNQLKECTVSLITSKSKVAPVRYLTIPKLELSAAV